MSKSLQEQLLGAGLVDKKKAKQISKAQRKKKTEELRSGEKVLTESQKHVQQAKLDKQERDRQLNLERQAKAEQKAIAAQIIQLIQRNKIPREGAELSYNFKDGNVVKKIYVEQKILDQISYGRLCIVRSGESYEVIPAPVADKIIERDAEAVVVYNKKTEQEQAEIPKTDDDDYYAQFEIPDDLMW